MIKPLSAVGLFLAVLFLSSCQLTPSQRIEEYPHLYQTVAEQHRPLVQSGEICNGMNENAVFLAWGSPNNKSQDENNHSTWSYSRSVGVTTPCSGPNQRYYRDFCDSEYGYQYENSYRRYYEHNYARPFEHEYRRDFEREFKRDFKRDFKRKDKQENKGGYKKHYRRNYEREFERHYNHNYNYDYNIYYERYYTETVYVKEVYATVNFSNGEVSSWDR